MSIILIPPAVENNFKPSTTVSWQAENNTLPPTSYVIAPLFCTIIRNTVDNFGQLKNWYYLLAK